MKKTLLIFILIITSCSSDDETKINNSSLVGKWNWTNTDGGIGYHIHETPTSTDKTIILNLDNNYSYSILENGSEVSNGTYEVTMRESIYSGEIERYIIYSSEYKNQNTVISGIIRVLDNNNLLIADNYTDGVESEYVRYN